MNFKSDNTIYWCILEHIGTGIRYYSLPYDDINKYTPGNIVCDENSREYLIIGLTTVEPLSTLVNIM